MNSRKLFIGEEFDKGDITFIVQKVAGEFVEVLDKEYKERGSFLIKRTNLLDKRPTNSPVRPYRPYCEAYLGVGKYTSKDHKEAYNKWSGILKRCYCTTEKSYKYYKDCEIAEEWLNFQVFAEWFYNNYIFDGEVYHLDKDILCKGNKLYSPDTCCFVPRDINVLLTNRRNFRGDSLIGVYYKTRNKKFCAQCSDGESTSQTYLGLYGSEEEAFEVYKDFKEKVIKKQANKYRHLIKEDVYEALMNMVILRGD